MQSDVCSSLSQRLAGVVDGTASLTTEEQDHVASCLVCQAEVVNYKRLLRAMHDLREVIVQPSPGLLANILDGIGEKAEKRAVMSLVTKKRAAYTGGIAVAAAAGIAGVVIFGRTKTKSKSRLRRAA